MRPLIVSALLLLLCVAGCNKWSDARVAETKRRGDVICRAVEAFHVRTGRFPIHLADLQPDHLREIPQPTAGDGSWDYIVIDSGTNYNLLVSASEHASILQRGADGKWDYMR
jgi:hypothetical protein